MHQQTPQRLMPLNLSHLSLDSEISTPAPSGIQQTGTTTGTPTSQYTKTLFTATPSHSSTSSSPRQLFSSLSQSSELQTALNRHHSETQNVHTQNLAVLFPHPTPYYQKKIIFACNNASNRELTQLVLRLGRLHKNGYISRYNADILLRMTIEGHTTKNIIETKIFGWPEGVRDDLIEKEDLRVVYDARVERLLGEVVREREEKEKQGVSGEVNGEVSDE